MVKGTDTKCGTIINLCANDTYKLEEVDNMKVTPYYVYCCAKVWFEGTSNTTLWKM